jgi:hypothetical protein
MERNKMKDEHKNALLNGERLVSPTGFLIWSGKSGYFNCLDPDCMSCEDWDLTWAELESWYNQWKEEEWEID